MLYMIGSDSVPSLERTQSYLPNVGMLLAPGRAWRTPVCAYACDNGVYSAFVRGKYWSEDMEAGYFKMLDSLPLENPPLWVLLPDVVADWNATLALAQIYLPILRERRIPTAIALQDGCDFSEALALDTDAVFVAGSTEWKLANVYPAVEFFRPLGKWVHVGRVNTGKRLKLCLRAGVDSCDGTGLNQFFDRMISPLVNCWQNETRQPCLSL